MKFALIICTYMRPKPVLQLLQSVVGQTVYPDEIIIVDGSLNSDTATVLNQNFFKKVHYHLVAPEHRGLTKQRNYGVGKVSDGIDIVCFLDDDTVLEKEYFEQILKTYTNYPQALGVGGYINNENKFQFVGYDYQPTIKEFYYNGWKQNDGSRFVLRKKLGLDSDCPPGYSSLYSHGRSVGFLPPSGKTYEVEMLMGGVSSFRKKVFETLQFSTYFEGYGLYEDADFTLRVAKIGKLYLNTGAKLNHYHDAAGRPNHYNYGKMVVRNGWYVWRTKNPSPTLKHQLKWHAITLLLTGIRYSNVLTTSNKKEALTEALGRTMGWWNLFVNKPK
ncbi:MAG: glycosyltransferase [Flavobacterium sp.]|uniref:glycosyltransferase family 2 protein n=1 Tax=Flavobacterium sp. TaxID=239 RepID=UPI002733C341|nr:glycosyltransferase [Flavobacterium sp.]MDP3679669.1 glycosyltransferase [Flavobacterium sp.]MDZ4329337.1 glycosyltransferase [Flavobacterium sp.]